MNDRILFSNKKYFKLIPKEKSVQYMLNQWSIITSLSRATSVFVVYISNMV